MMYRRLSFERALVQFSHYITWNRFAAVICRFIGLFVSLVVGAASRNANLFFLSTYSTIQPRRNLPTTKGGYETGPGQEGAQRKSKQENRKSLSWKREVSLFYSFLFASAGQQ